MLVATTALILVTGVWLLLLGHHSDLVLTVHKVSFIVWSGIFGLHFLAYVPTAARSFAGAPPAGRTGSRVAAALALSSIGAGVLVALALLARIDAWHGHRFF